MQKAKISISTTTVEEVLVTTPVNSFLEKDEVVVFKIFLPDFFRMESHLSTYLNEDERNKANRFYNAVDQQRYIAYCSIFKIILAFFSKKEIQNIKFDVKANKKPFLADCPGLHFNMAHAEDFAVLALSNTEVGIDIEYIDKTFEFEMLIPEVICKSEIPLLENSSSKQHDFYTSWTRKEALVKATGQGIDNCFKEIPTVDGVHNTLLNNTNAGYHWNIVGFNFVSRYKAAIAYETEAIDSRNIRLYRLTTEFENYFTED